MAKSRLLLQGLLQSLLPDGKRAYFQPPNGTQMQYPCIVYTLDDENVTYASNERYLTMNRYQVSVIDRDPDSQIPAKVGELPLCSFNRRYVADNLNHTVYSLFF